LLDENGKVAIKANLSFLDVDSSGKVLVKENEGEETKTLELETFLREYMK